MKLNEAGPGMAGRVTAALALWTIGFVCPVMAQLEDARCLSCHGNTAISEWSPEMAAAMVAPPPGGPVLRSREQMKELYVDGRLLTASAHAGLSCTQCHVGIDRTPHAQRLATLTCADCHTEVEADMARSVHAPRAGEGRRMPGCADCHGGPHQVSRIDEPLHWRQKVVLAEACAACHAGGATESWRENIHGRALLDKGLPASAGCADCHGAHAILPPQDPASKIHPAHVPETCGGCHEGVAETYFGSVHGQHLLDGDPRAASCTSCHSSHGIGRVDEPFLLGMIEECSTCHMELGRTYLLSYHGQASALGEASVAACSSCHGAHDILPAADPDSQVAAGNLMETCGSCHEGVNPNFVQYLAHVDPRDPSSPAPVFYTWLIMTTLLLSVLVVFVPHGLLWLQRTFIERLRHPRGFHAAPMAERRIRRFSLVHRITHALIVVSFLGLVITGFPLKYSYEGWAQRLVGALGGVPMLGLAHRVFAVISFIYVAIHLGWLAWFFWKKCPRPRWRYVVGPESLLPMPRDLVQAFQMLRWFLWLGPRPKFDRWTYYEKLDYWGEAWGMILIGGTGLILWFPEFFTRWLPGWVLNSAFVIHSIEALLAASVIFLVHFFNTHLRPEKFPVDMVMLTGQMTESEMKEERPAEYERLAGSGELEGLVVKPVALKWRIAGGILGVIAFSVGMALIVLIIRGELAQVLGH